MNIDKKAYQEFKKRYKGVTYHGKQISVPMILTDDYGVEFQINDNYIPVCDIDGYFWAMDFGDEYIDAYGTPYSKNSCIPLCELPENKGYDDVKIDEIISTMETWIRDLGIDAVLDFVEAAQEEVANG